MGGMFSSAQASVLAPTPVVLTHTLIVILVGLVGASLSEAFAWYFVYRKESYQTILDEVKRANRKLEEQKKATVRSAKNNARLKSQEEQLAQKLQSLSFMKMKAGIFSSVFYFLVVPMFNNAFKGTVVARLPFQPILFFRGLAHHGFTTFAEVDCSSVYLYMLSVGFFATALQKLVGATPPKAASSAPSWGSPSGPLLKTE